MSKDSRVLQQLPSEDLEELKAPTPRGLNLRPLLRTAKRKSLLIGGIAGLAFAAALASSSRKPDVYQGSFRLLVEPVNSESKLADPSLLTRTDRGVLPPGRSTEFFGLDYPTQLQILQSPKMLSAIAEQVKAQYPDFTVKKLKKGFTVQRIGEALVDETRIIEVTYEGNDPKQVEAVLEKAASKYLKYSLEERKTRIAEAVRFIEEQLPNLQKSVDSLQTKLQNLQQKHSLLDSKVQAEDLSKQVLVVTKELLEAQRQLQEQRTLYTNLQRQLDLTPEEALVASTLSQDPNRAALLGKLKELESKIAEESARFTLNSPNLQALQEQRQSLLKLVNQQTQQIVGRNRTDKLGNPQLQIFQNSVRLDLINQLITSANQMKLLEARALELTETKKTFELQAQQFPAITRQYNDLIRQLEITTQTLNQLLAQRETLRVEEAQKNFPWELIANPEIPRDADGKLSPVPKSPVKKLAIAILGGMLLGLGAAVLIEKYRNIFYTIEDIIDATEWPILGGIPLNKKRENLKKERLTKWMKLTRILPKLEGINHNSYNFLEAFESLYASVHFLYSAPPIRSLVVCSAGVSDGKSTIALYLAQTAAEMGQRVLLVDANLRSPQLHTWLQLQNNRGLSDLLLNQKLVPNFFIERSPESDNLFVLTAGQPLPDSPKQLASAQMHNLMEELQATFDLVIYDTPNLFSYTDASFLAAHTDGILMVVGVRKTKKSAVMQALNQLNTFRLPILGIVANYVEPQSLATLPGIHRPPLRPSTEFNLDSPHEPSLPEMNSKSV